MHHFHSVLSCLFTSKKDFGISPVLIRKFGFLKKILKDTFVGDCVS